MTVRRKNKRKRRSSKRGEKRRRRCAGGEKERVKEERVNSEGTTERHSQPIRKRYVDIKEEEEERKK